MTDKPKSDDHDITDQIDDDRKESTPTDEALRQTDGSRGSGGRENVEADSDSESGATQHEGAAEGNS